MYRNDRGETITYTNWRRNVKNFSADITRIHHKSERSFVVFVMTFERNTWLLRRYTRLTVGVRYGWNVN